ncbi:putative nuclease HARBI1 [Bombina bombina]|uniref:putative nuclease HARBI1 n=1 Tax=Bombina bombina TaxID=8345 RepID=UPI00235A744C|nr:putative nuclease HARBI1 [Bombina bombina]
MAFATGELESMGGRWSKDIEKTKMASSPTPTYIDFRIGLHALSDREIVLSYRLNRVSIERLFLEIKDSLEPITYRTKATPGMLKLLAVLYFLATGSFQAVTSLDVGMSQATFSKHLSVVLNALHQRLVHYVQFPKTPEDWHRVKLQFYMIARMTNFLGTIDYAHVLVRPPKGREEPYHDRKHNHSLNIQVISDAKLRIINIPGATHDSFILRNSTIHNMFQDQQMPEEIQAIHVPWLFITVLNPTTPAQVRYNEAHTSVIERTFGVLKSRFHCLDISGGVLQYPPKKSKLMLEEYKPDSIISMLYLTNDHRQLEIVEVIFPFLKILIH